MSFENAKQLSDLASAFRRRFYQLELDKLMEEPRWARELDIMEVKAKTGEYEHKMQFTIDGALHLAMHHMPTVIRFLSDKGFNVTRPTNSSYLIISWR